MFERMLERWVGRCAKWESLLLLKHLVCLVTGDLSETFDAVLKRSYVNVRREKASESVRWGRVCEVVWGS